MEYDDANQLTKIIYPTGQFLEYTYDSEGRRTKMVDPEGNSVNYAYDIDGRLVSLTDETGSLIVSYIYDSLGRLLREDNGNGTYTIYTYGLGNQITSLVNYAADGSINSSFDYTYDDLGQQIGVTSLKGEWNYIYDDAGQLINGVFDSNNSDIIPDQNLTYVYDRAGNRIKTIQNGLTTTYQSNNLDQYTALLNLGMRRRVCTIEKSILLVTKEKKKIVGCFSLTNGHWPLATVPTPHYFSFIV